MGLTLAALGSAPVTLTHVELFAGLRIAAILFWGQILIRIVAEPEALLPAAAPPTARRLLAVAVAANAAAVALGFSPAQVMALSGWPDVAWLERLLVAVGLIGINISAQCVLAALAVAEGLAPVQWRINVALTFLIIVLTGVGWAHV